MSGSRLEDPCTHPPQLQKHPPQQIVKNADCGVRWCGMVGMSMVGVCRTWRRALVRCMSAHRVINNVCVLGGLGEWTLTLKFIKSMYTSTTLRVSAAVARCEQLAISSSRVSFPRAAASASTNTCSEAVVANRQGVGGDQWQFSRDQEGHNSAMMGTRVSHRLQQSVVP